ncbi:Hsp20/alpha crystallin family protein [uncultured Eubacterium sp.]|uniref:Hsp20/alpha crystallin family protein n=1 Tax=uncultured Eubacterium sp. TaxID=165185 RepID=UPI0025969BC3|nr:Hsp20/alpha crystallin family protein [uncultured Eubacterium sp.]
MLAPSIFGMNDLFDDFGDVFEFSPAFRKQVAAARNISSDIKELADGYQIEMELPGFSKEEVKAQLKDGYLTITAEHNAENKEENNEEGQKKEAVKYVRRERYYGKCQRSFFVGKNVTEEDINAKFENGILTMYVPKEVKKPQVEEKFITIE